MDVVLPGELVHLPKPSTKLGPGTLIDKEKGQVYFCKAGIVKRGGNDSVWVHCLKKRVSRDIYIYTSSWHAGFLSSFPHIDST